MRPLSTWELTQFRRTLYHDQTHRGIDGNETLDGADSRTFGLAIAQNEILSVKKVRRLRRWSEQRD